MIKKKINWNKYTPFQQRVLKYIMRIPKGKTMTYGQVAKALGNRHLARAVGGALAANKDLPLIPCYRVVGYNGMGGYSGKGGIKGKLRLLKQEGHSFKGSALRIGRRLTSNVKPYAQRRRIT